MSARSDLARHVLSRLRSEQGSAVAEFALVAALLALIFAGVLQVCLSIHVRNTAIDSALAGARVLAMGDGTEAEARAVTQNLLANSLGSRYAGSVDIDYEVHGADQIAVVRVTTGLPLVGMWGPADVLSVQGRAIVEPNRGASIWAG